MYKELMVYNVPREEMVKHLEARRDYHRERARAKAEEAEKLDRELAADLERAGTVTERMEIKGSSSYSNTTTARQTARSSMQHHLKMARTFDFKVSHLPAGDLFVLNSEDLDELEFLL